MNDTADIAGRTAAPTSSNVDGLATRPNAGGTGPQDRIGGGGCGGGGDGAMGAGVSTMAGAAKRCSGCGTTIVDRFLLHAMDCYWHVGCLRCSTCQARLDEVVATCYTRSGMILCRKDYIRMFGAAGTCASCRQMIPAGQFVMKARGEAYHVACFNCVVCRARLVPGDRFALVNGGLVCERDYPKVAGTGTSSVGRATGSRVDA